LTIAGTTARSRRPTRTPSTSPGTPSPARRGSAPEQPKTQPRRAALGAGAAQRAILPPALTSNDLMQQEPGVWVEGPDGELIPDYESTFPEITEGQVVHGTVVRVDKDEVLVDIGYKSEGVIPIAELSIRRSINPADEVSVGDEIDALVLIKEDTEG